MKSSCQNTMETRRRHSSNSSIPIFDTKPLNVDVNSLTLSSDQNLFQPVPSVSRLPSFQHKPNRQKLSLTTRKCLSSNVTPISSPIIPRSVNNNNQPPPREFSKEIIESSAQLINDIDITLSQLSKQYYSDNNNIFDQTSESKAATDHDISPTSLQNNNGTNHFSYSNKDLCDCESMQKLKFHNNGCPVKSTHELDPINGYRKCVSNPSYIPSPHNDAHNNQRSSEPNGSATSRATKLPINNYCKPQELTPHESHENIAHRSTKYSGRKIKSSAVSSNGHRVVDTTNPTYTEAWVYNTQDKPSPVSIQSKGDSNISAVNRNEMQSALPIFQKPIFAQHRHSRNDTCQPPKYVPRIPLPNRKLKDNNFDYVTNRDSGIYLSCPKDGSIDSRVSNNNAGITSLPEPPPRVSSLVYTPQNTIPRCVTLYNHNSSKTKELSSNGHGTPKSASKTDRRKAKELFASLKQREETKAKSITDSNTGPPMKEDQTSFNDKKVMDAPNSDLETSTVEDYCSDMDNLKNSGYLSDNSGYLSEGGIGLYAHKMQQRFKEGLLAVQESLQMTSHNKIIVNRMGSFERDDLSSTSSEEIEDYLRELSSRLECPSMCEASTTVSTSRCQGKEAFNTEVESERKNRMYQARLEKYACDVEPAADFDITSSCSMDLLTGKALSDAVSDDDSADYKHIRVLNTSTLSRPIASTSGRKSSMDSCLAMRKMSSRKPKYGYTEILEAAGPTPAIFEDDISMRGGEVDHGHYRAMSLPGRPRPSGGWPGETTSLSRRDADYIYPFPPPPPASAQSKAPPPLPQPSQQTNNHVYYEVPVCRSRAGRSNGTVSSTPSLLNVRLPYATTNQGVKNSCSTTSLGRRESDTDDVYDGLGSHLSLLSTGSYRSLNEDRQATEIRKLRRELELAQSKVRTLSGQLSNNGSLVAAFEGTLQSMSMRLQRFAANSESKESELNDLKSTIESLKKHAGSSPTPDPSSPKIYSSSSLTSLSSNSNSNEKRSDGSKKSSWFKASIGRAFKKKSSKDDGSTESINEIPNKGRTQNQNNVLSMIESESLQAMRKELEEKDARLTDVQLDALSRSHQLEQLRDQLTKMRYEMSSLKADNNRLQCLMTTSNGAVSTLDQSISGESVTDSLDHQDNTLKAASKFKDIISRPKFDFLNALVKETDCSQAIMVYMSLKNVNKALPLHGHSVMEDTTNIPIGRIGLNARTSWSDLETSIRRLLKEYVSAIDPFSSLGLSGDSIARYRINNDTFIPISSTGGMRPLTSPLAASENNPNSKLFIELKNYSHSNSIDDMVFEFLIPRPILLRYFGLLYDHKRIILSGPSGTGKSYLAHKLAWNLASRCNRDPASSILVFNLDKKSSKELRGYMATLTEQLQKTDPQGEPCLSLNGGQLPLVIILDNLHHVSSFSEIFNSFLSIHHTRSPFVIGTMNQLNSVASNNLQLHHNFRWVLCTNHMEPVKGFLGRYLRRQFLRHQIETKQSLFQLYHVIEWMSIVWQHINKFLESYSSPDVTIGPRLFLNCPMSIEDSRAWFIDLWNHSLVPYVLDAVRDGLNTHGRKQATWDDPTDWIIRSWPWNDLCNSISTNSGLETSNLIRLRPEDVGFDSYQLITTTSSHISPYSVSASHMGVDPLHTGSGRHSMMLERRPRTSDRSDHCDAALGKFLKSQEKNGRKK